MMKTHLLLLIFIYILYIVFLGVLMFRRRASAVKNGQVNLKYFKSYQAESTYELEVIKNHFDNQFQVPILFFFTCLAAVQLEAVSVLTLVLGYLFIFSRLVHSFIHLGQNNVLHRSAVYMFGFLMVLAMWVQIIFRVISIAYFM